MVTPTQVNLSNIYAGKKVLITGHTGFKGAWMLAWLHQLGAHIKGYALAPSHDNDLYSLLNGDGMCDSVIGDICDRNKITQVINAFEPDFIFHLAAQSLVRRSYALPAYTFDVNIMGTVNLLEAVRQLPGRCSVVIVTTDKVYKNNETGIPFRESDPLGGHDPYSASKAAVEIVFSSYRDSFFNPKSFEVHNKAIASARAGNVIGGGDRAEDRIIPDIVRGIERNESILVRNPKAVRPWQHVLEPLNGYLTLGARLSQYPQTFATGWNFGPHTGDVLTVEEVVEKALKMYGKGHYETPPQINQPHEAGLLTLDISKAIEQLHWRPKLTSMQAIQLTIDWYKSAASEDAAVLTYNQINKYQNL